jgi:hypothetical protein
MFASNDRRKKPLSETARYGHSPQRYIEPLNVRDVERRINRACKTIRALPDREQRFLSYGQGIWANYIRDAKESYGVEEEVKPRFRPTPFDVSDVLRALSWCRALESNEFDYSWWRSYDISFGVIATWIGRSDETARLRYKDAIIKAWYEANTELRQADGRMELL